MEDPDKEAKIESTFVRITETPSERESAVVFLTENGDGAYAVDREASHPPPSKVFVCDKPESVTEPCPGGLAGHTLSATSAEVIHQVIDQVLQGVPAQASSISEPSPESSILLSRKDNRRSLSLPIKKWVHFEADTHQDASCSKDAFRGQDGGFEGSPRGTEDLLQQDGHHLAVGVAEEKPEQEAPQDPAVASAEAPGDASLAGGKMGNGQTAQRAPSWNGALAGAGSQGEGRHPLSSLGENAATADSLDIEVRLLTVEPPAGDDRFEGIPPKASQFNRDLVDLASTSQAFGAAPPPAEKRPAADAVPGRQAETLGKRKSKSARWTQDASDQHGPREDGGPGEAPADETLQVHGKAKCKSPRGPRGEDDDAAGEGPQGPGCGRDPADPPSSSVSLETLASGSEESLGVRPSPPASKTCVVPHDLFYYPHYEVALATVLEASAEGTEDPRDEGPAGRPREPGPREPAGGGPEASRSSCSLLGPGRALPGAASSEDQQRREAAGSPPGDSQQVGDSRPPGELGVPGRHPETYCSGGGHSRLGKGRAGRPEPSLLTLDALALRGPPPAPAPPTGLPGGAHRPRLRVQHGGHSRHCKQQSQPHFGGHLVSRSPSSRGGLGEPKGELTVDSRLDFRRPLARSALSFVPCGGRVDRTEGWAGGTRLPARRGSPFGRPSSSGALLQVTRSQRLPDRQTGALRELQAGHRGDLERGHGEGPAGG